MVAANPFADARLTDDVRLNVTFLGGDGNTAAAVSAGVAGVRFLEEIDRAVFSVLHLGEVGTRDAMTVLEKTFGKQITTRSWNVIEEINARYL